MEKTKEQIEEEVNKTPIPTFIKYFSEQRRQEESKTAQLYLVSSETICNSMNDFAERTSVRFLEWCDIHSWCRPDVLEDRWIQYFPAKNQSLPPLTSKELFNKFISEK